MANFCWDDEGTIIEIDADGNRWRLIGSAGPEVCEKKERFRNLQEEFERLEDRANAIRVEQQKIVEWLAIRANAKWSR